MTHFLAIIIVVSCVFLFNRVVFLGLVCHILYNSTNAVVFWYLLNTCIYLKSDTKLVK